MNENLRLLKPFFRGLPIIILVVVLSVLAAKKYLSYATPMYESTAKLKLADTQEGVPSTNLFKDLDVFANANKIATEIEVLKSATLIGKTLKGMGFETEIYRKGEVKSVELFQDSPILASATFPGKEGYDVRYIIVVKSLKRFDFILPNQKVIKGKFGQPISHCDGKILIQLNDAFIASKKNLNILDTYEVEFLSELKMQDKIATNLDIVSVDKDVPVIRINYKSNVPEKAALFVNKLAETYIKDYIETKFRAANVTVNFLKGEIENTNKDLNASEDDIQNYRDQKNIINIRQETETDLRKISQLKIQQTNLKMSLDAIKELNQYIAKGKDNYLDLAANFEAFTDLLSTEMIKSMKRLQSEKKDLLLVYTPENDKVKVVDQKLKDLIDYQIESIKNTEKNLKVKYDELSNDIVESEKVFIGLPERERLMNELTREFNLYEKSYNFLNEKRIEAEIAKSAKLAFHKIITHGEVSKTPVSPIKSIIIIVAAVLGLLFSVSMIYLVHFAKAKVNDIFTIEKNTSIPIAIATPYLTSKNAIEINFLKEAVQLELKGIIKEHTIVTLTSNDREKDHLFHIKYLTKALFEQDRKVLVIDVAGNLKDEFSKHFPTITCLDYSDLKYMHYTQTMMQQELAHKLEAFDICIVNNQSVKCDRLALLFMSLASHNLFVLDSRKTEEKTIVKVDLLREEYQIPNLWFVLNKSEYNPSVIKEIRMCLTYLKKRIRP